MPCLEQRCGGIVAARLSSSTDWQLVLLNSEMSQSRLAASFSHTHTRQLIIYSVNSSEEKYDSRSIFSLRDFKVDAVKFREFADRMDSAGAADGSIWWM